MADLVSPGVQVTIIDQSQYAPPASSSVPLVLIATASNKANPTATGIAPGTARSNANKLYQVTSQRDLVNLFGNPFFYKTATNTPLHGYELNEYGLLTAYSVLGSTNRCYVLRADIDLAGLVGRVGRPTGTPTNGTWWLDTTNSKWGIYQWNATTQKFVEKMPHVLVDLAYLQQGSTVPLSSVGNQGDYAVVAIPLLGADPITDKSTYYYKTSNNEWVPLGSSMWGNDIPAVIGGVSNPTLTAGTSFSISLTGAFTVTVTVPSSPSNTVQGVADIINGLGLDEFSARAVAGRLQLFSSQKRPNGYIRLANVSGSPVADLGFVEARNYYQPELYYGTSAMAPLWSSSMANPRPTGSVWIKTSVVGSGVNLVLSRYNSSLTQWVTQSCSVYTSNITATYALDSTGGKNIAAGTAFANLTYFDQSETAPMQIRTRLAAGAMIATGAISNPSVPNNASVAITVSIPNSTLTRSYLVTTPVTGTLTANDFVTAWSSANITNTMASVTSTGEVQLEHMLGGDIYLNDYVDSSGNPTITSSGLISALGLDGSVNSSYGPFSPIRVSTAPVIGGSGSGATLDITANGTDYIYNGVSGNGVDYVVGDLISISGLTFGGIAGTNDVNLVVLAVDVDGGILNASIRNTVSTAEPIYSTCLSNWVPLETYTANEGAPVNIPPNGTNWFYTANDQIDIMVQMAGQWVGYRNQPYDFNGHPIIGSGNTDPNGPIFATEAPTLQSTNTPLQYGDLWIDSNDLENYPTIYRWQRVDGINQWVKIDSTDNVSSNGILFADARWAGSNSVNPANDPIPTIKSLLTSNFVDLDCPNPDLYPNGMLLWNTRRSGYNVKQFKTNYFNAIDFPDQPLPINSYTWVSVSGLKVDGSPYMGRKAQRAMVVQALNATVTTNMTIREEDTFFNLIACPNYPELQPAMIGLNNERNNTAYIVGDTPLRLRDDATEINDWAKNANNAAFTGEDGLVSRDEYMGLYFPGGMTTDLTGAAAVVPASHMILRTMLRNDTIAYPWLAPAGTRRGNIDNASSIGYIDPTTNEYVSIKNRNAIRDVLYSNNINPLASFTGVGLVNYGNKNSKSTNSAMDRTNVARLVCYIRERLQVIARPFIFEPNDGITRQQITGVVQSLFIDLVSKRGLYDYLVKCDAENNTPDRIDKNQLWIDIAIEPVKAAEFIYIPVRILNTGGIAAGKAGF